MKEVIYEKNKTKENGQRYLKKKKNVIKNQISKKMEEDIEKKKRKKKQKNRKMGYNKEKKNSL